VLDIAVIAVVERMHALFKTQRLSACMVDVQPCAAQLLVQSKVPGTMNICMQFCSPEYLIDDRSKVCHEPSEVAKSPRLAMSP
jgi:hypothetical protein